jgi:hypothetical protein
MADLARQRLQELREALLKLHKALIEAERVSYEQTVGRIESPYQFLQLLTRDPWFAWLQPFSQLIVAIDEAVDSEEAITASQTEAFIREAGLLLVPSETGQGLSQHYYEAMQRDPDVVLAHGGVMSILRSRPEPSRGAG